MSPEHQCLENTFPIEIYFRGHVSFLFFFPFFFAVFF